jgi:hypothetical protein
MQKILSEISIGELLDKISILKIKKLKIKDKNKQKLILNEYKLLNKQKKKIKIKKNITELYNQLILVNLKLWNIEDKIRKLEKNKSFGKKFIHLARNVYKYNDKRSNIKLSINTLTKSNIIEVKSYLKYN